MPWRCAPPSICCGPFSLCAVRCCSVCPVLLSCSSCTLLRFPAVLAPSAHHSFCRVITATAFLHCCQSANHHHVAGPPPSLAPARRPLLLPELCKALAQAAQEFVNVGLAGAQRRCHCEVVARVGVAVRAIAAERQAANLQRSVMVVGVKQRLRRGLPGWQAGATSALCMPSVALMQGQQTAVQQCWPGRTSPARAPPAACRGPPRACPTRSG